jgi:hypothetical protein
MFHIENEIQKCLGINFDDLLDIIGTLPTMIQNRTLDLKTLA